MRLTLKTARATFHYVALAGIVLAIVVGAWDVAGVILVAALTVFFAYRCAGAAEEDDDDAQKGNVPQQMKLAAGVPAPTQLAEQAAAAAEAARGGRASGGGAACSPEPPTRVPLYEDSDWDFVKPLPSGGITEQTFLRPSPDRVVEPLHARQAFVKEWAKDADAFAVKDRYTIRADGTQKIDRRF